MHVHQHMHTCTPTNTHTYAYSCARKGSRSRRRRHSTPLWLARIPCSDVTMPRTPTWSNRSRGSILRSLSCESHASRPCMMLTVNIHMICSLWAQISRMWTAGMSVRKTSNYDHICRNRNVCTVSGKYSEHKPILASTCFEFGPSSLEFHTNY